MPQDNMMVAEQVVNTLNLPAQVCVTKEVFLLTRLHLCRPTQGWTEQKESFKVAQHVYTMQPVQYAPVATSVQAFQSRSTKFITENGSSPNVYVLYCLYAALEVKPTLTKKKKAVYML